MKLNYKCLGLVMFVMLVCCVSAASATDVDNITVPDDTDVIEIDEAVDSVEEVEQTSGVDTCDCTNCDCEIETLILPTRSNSITLTPSNYTSKFTNNEFNDENVDEVIFNGDFSSTNYKTLSFNQAITITATESTWIKIILGKSDFNNVEKGTIDNLEYFVKKYVNFNSKNIREDIKIQQDLSLVLDFLIKNGSNDAFRLNEWIASLK